ncbi:hypothetical protein L1N85_10315 [Paenibacillus alkaliterrae]|uniref:hypothetical protein n=1 Tax=Paenibacillus alkaliterrae TaxID=320909 RepID=UPI001F46BEDE|nr:hypothetical protein [Paenibacillus alkaliterrae]MCF2938829.1 hypothetical protein [Paenibacillus alkaliterrae]
MNESNQEKYVFLLEKGYIRRTDGGYLFNAVWLDSSDTLRKLNNAMPDLSKLYAPAIAKLYEGMLQLSMQNQPKQTITTWMGPVK